MCIHHCATILLIAFSYSINMLNIGTVIMVLHDFSDIFLEVSTFSLLLEIAYFLEKAALFTTKLILRIVFTFDVFFVVL